MGQQILGVPVTLTVRHPLARAVRAAVALLAAGAGSCRPEGDVPFGHDDSDTGPCATRGDVSDTILHIHDSRSETVLDECLTDDSVTNCWLGPSYYRYYYVACPTLDEAVAERCALGVPGSGVTISSCSWTDGDTVTELDMPPLSSTGEKYPVKHYYDALGSLIAVSADHTASGDGFCCDDQWLYRYWYGDLPPDPLVCTLLYDADEIYQRWCVLLESGGTGTPSDSGGSGATCPP